jgi:GntR family transcriptional regulator/MocR family aminotransferase
LPASLAATAQRIMTGTAVRASLLGQGALARFIADGHFTAHLRRTRLLYAERQQALIEAADRPLKGLLEIAPDPGGMHLIARPSAAIAARFDDHAVSAACAVRGVSVAPLSACYSARPKQHGLLLGYAGTPAGDMAPALAILRSVLQQVKDPSRRSG